MTIAERLRQEGHQIGWQEGKLEGLQEGMHEQAIKIALRMLEQGPFICISIIGFNT